MGSREELAVSLHRIADLIDQAEATTEPQERVVAFGEAIEALRLDVLPLMATRRRAAARALKAQGLTFDEMGVLLGMSQARARQLVG